jgi:hypothetical protein
MKTRRDRIAYENANQNRTPILKQLYLVAVEL